MNLNLTKAIEPRCRAALDFMDHRIRSGVKLGLDSTRRLLERVGNPHLGMKFIHVAGTNGKGSTAAMVAGALTHCGLRTGFFSSPHLVNFRERYRVDLEAITEIELAEVIEEIQEKADDLFGKDESPSFFEVSTVIGLMHFRKRDCDVVVLEVGMGGRLDATNVVDPLLSVITRIDFDHVRPLGDTLTAIAGEKAGIIKPNRPVVVGAQPEEALVRILEKADECNSPTTVAGRDFGTTSYDFLPDTLMQRNVLSFQGEETRLDTRFLGPHQLENAATAWAAVNVACKLGVPIDLEQAAEGFKMTKWPARMDQLDDGTLIDAAHNVSGIGMLTSALQRCFPEKRWNLLFGALGTKDWRSMLDGILPYAQSVAITSFDHKRVASTDDMADYVREQYPQLPLTVEPDVDAAFDWCGEQEGDRLVAGSLYMAGAVLARYTDGFPVVIR
jgi:dihydrofolate synthase/folylpolyglutamate synthase